MRRLRAMLRELPKLTARHELMVLPARQVASGNLKRSTASSMLRELQRTARHGLSGATRRASGLEAFALIRAMNAKARAEGRLWEQLHPTQAEGAA